MSGKILDPEAVEQSFQDIESDLATLDEAYQELYNEIASLEAENERLRDKVQQHEEQLARLGEIGGDRTSKEEKIAAIIQFAENIRPDGSPKVVVKPRQIKGAAGVSRRYAYDLVEELPEQYDWATANDERIARAADAQTKAPPKGVLIDFREFAADNSWGVNKFTGDGEGVNKFTTPSRGKEGS